jgi:pSer/pThr/pTyr-binding forkhead associated (FHA) protein
VTGLIWLLRRKKGLLQQEKPVSQSIGNHHPLVPPARLLDLDKSSDQDEYIIQNEVTSIGRSPENNIIIANDPAVTRYNHAQIIFQDNKFYLKDLSANYSKINDKKIDKRVLVELNDGDVISIMENRFRFSLPVENKTVIFDENQFLIDQSRETEIMGNTP